MFCLLGVSDSPQNIWVKSIEFPKCFGVHLDECKTKDLWSESYLFKVLPCEATIIFQRPVWGARWKLYKHRILSGNRLPLREAIFPHSTYPAIKIQGRSYCYVEWHISSLVATAVISVLCLELSNLPFYIWMV